MSMGKYHWSKEDYFPYLIQNNKTSIIALEYLVDDLHNGKEETIDKFLAHCGSEDFLWGLVRLMSYSDARISGNSAYVIGTIAETENGTERIIDLLNNQSNPEAKNILLYMSNMLKTNDCECLMNAAGTIGTLSESKAGREWLLSQELLDTVIQLCTNLLDNTNLWVSSNAALVLARISIEDAGCKKLLSHESAEFILRKLIYSLGNDDAGRGMNCAFAIGRLCDQTEGRSAFIGLTKDINKLIGSLCLMVEQNRDYGCTKNACFALSCLASNKQAHEIIICHDSFNSLVNALCKSIVHTTDAETQWFAAMLIRVVASLPNGCVRLRTLQFVEQTLKSVTDKPNLYSDVKEEVDLAIELLKNIEKPNPPKVDEVGDTTVKLSWEEVTLKNKLQVQYIILSDTNCLYAGFETSCTINDLQPSTHYTFQLQLRTVQDNQKSELSDPIQITTEESTPSEPVNLKCAGSTTTLLKITWEPPEQMNGVFKAYYIYNGETMIEQTNELYVIVTGLSPGTTYDIQVCAATSKGKGALAKIKATTNELGDVTPEKPTFGPVGRREIFVKWSPPQVLPGKLNRYDLLMNGKCVYSGISLEHQICMLKPDTEYKFEVVALTNEGKFKSKVAKARTLKDEYDAERPPLYPGTTVLNMSQVPSALLVSNDPPTPPQPIKKRVSQDSVSDTSNKLMQRQKTKLKIFKQTEKVVTLECQDFNTLSKSFFDTSVTTLPPVQQQQQQQQQQSSPNDDQESVQTQVTATSKATYVVPTNIFRPQFSNVFNIVAKSKDTNNTQPHRSPTFYQQGVPQVRQTSENRISAKLSGLGLDVFQNIPMKSMERSKTLNGFNKLNKKYNNNNNNNNNNSASALNSSNAITVNIKEMQPEFPSLQPSPTVYPIQINSEQIITIITTQNDPRLLKNFMPLQYRHMFRKISKEKTMPIDDINGFMRSNTIVNTGDAYRSTRNGLSNAYK